MTTTPVLVLLHSPLVGPLTWELVADRLQALGYHVVVPSLHGAVGTSQPYYRGLARRAGQVIDEHPMALAEPVALVGHSGAGALLPAITEATGAQVEAAVFVDAILPHPRASWFDTAPAALGAALRDAASGGWLPPWDQWFTPEAIAAELPDADLRARFVAELPRVPLAYFEEQAPEVESWPPPHCGYLQLSEAYKEVADEAERQGWPTMREPASHLAMLTQPEWVSGMLHRLVTRLDGA
ncbi:MAG TPA: alpha/beta hydrolase [Actinomycetes bacterium]